MKKINNSQYINHTSEDRKKSWAKVRTEFLINIISKAYERLKKTKNENVQNKIQTTGKETEEQ